MRIAQQRAGVVMGIGRLGCIEGTLREVVGHDGAVKHPLPAFARRNSREQKCQKVQKITGKITVVSRYDQPADGVLLHDFIGFILQSLGIDRFVDEAWILFQHGGKDLVLALVSFPPADPLKLLQKVILPKRFIGAEIVIRQFRLLGEPISLVCLRAVVPAVRQIGRAELVTLNGNGGQKLIVQLGGLFRFLLAHIGDVQRMAVLAKHRPVVLPVHATGSEPAVSLEHVLGEDDVHIPDGMLHAPQIGDGVRPAEGQEVFEVHLVQHTLDIGHTDLE